MKTLAGIMRMVGACLVLALCVGLTACSTPATRIREQQELFSTYPAYVRDMIRKGEVDVGFTEEMVHMALGEPDRRYSRETIGGLTAIWAYTETYTRPARQRVRGTFRVRDNDGRYRTVEDTVWAEVDQKYEFEVRRIEFRHGLVVAIEEVEPERTLLTSPF